jgi:cation:H+ antiporter
VPEFGAFPLWQNLLFFSLAAVVVWLAGTRLSIDADVIADRSGLGQVFIGLVLLATVTSLPEIGRTVMASAIGNASLAVSSLFGGIVLQTAILAVADLTVAERGLTYFAPRPVLLLQGVLVVVLLALALAAVAAGEFLTLFQVGLWSVLLFALYLLSLYLLRSYEGRRSWVPVDVPEELKAEAAAREEASGGRAPEPMNRILLRFSGSSALIFIAGVVMAQIGDVLAVQTGLGSGFVGATLLAFAGALPEMSVTISAVRLGAYSMAIANIFGTNALLVALLLLGDIFYRPGPILHAIDQSSVFAASMGIVATSVYLVGLIERRNKRVLGMGLDSATVMVLYGFTLIALFLMR